MKAFLVIAAFAVNSLFCMAQLNGQTNLVGGVFASQGGDTPEGTFRFASGGFEVYTIASADKDFQPASLYYGKDNADKTKVDILAPDGKVPTAMNCFVISTPRGYVMFDTGLPSDKGGKTIERLKSLGITPEDIQAIFVTHSHFDHIGGLLDEGGKAQYPSATVYIASGELAFMRETMSETLDRITAAYSNKVVSFAFGEVLPYDILPISAAGHTPGHTAYQLGNLLFVGDIMHGAAIQLIDPTINARFDADPALAVTTRKSILNYAVSHSLTVLGAHIPLNGVIF